MNVATVWNYPQEDLGSVIIKAGWAYDNFYETGTAHTLDAAVQACKDAWNTPEEYIFIVDRLNRGKVLYRASERIREN